MQRTANTQMRTLKLIELLLSESSQAEPLSSSKILRQLEKQGMYTTRSTLKSDIALLRRHGFEIESVALPSGEHFYIKKSGDAMKQTPVCFEISEKVSQAIESRTKLAVAVKNVGELTVSPYAVLRDKRGYYVACFSPAHRRIVLLPFSKLSAARSAEEPSVQPPSNYSVAYYTARGFELCQSVSETVTLSFEPELLGSVMEQFGDSVLIDCEASGLMCAQVSTTVSPSFFTWLFCLGGRVRIVSPEYVCCEYKSRLRSQLAAY